jgi:hypothetical protein
MIYPKSILGLLDQMPFSPAIFGLRVRGGYFDGYIDPGQAFGRQACAPGLGHAK